jgi:hypothetical protein
MYTVQMQLCVKRTIDSRDFHSFMELSKLLSLLM